MKDESKPDGESGESTAENKSSEEEKKDEQPAGEFSAMQQADRAKAAAIEGKERIFPRGPMDPILVSLLADEVVNLENLICQPILPTMIKHRSAKRYSIARYLTSLSLIIASMRTILIF